MAKLRQLPEWPAARLVFLGDLVDRGSWAKATVQMVIDLLAEKPGSVCVMGYHDLALVKAAGLDGEPPSASWVRRYGEYDHMPTFRAYLGREPQYHDFADWEADLAALKAAMPESHQKFLAGLPWLAEAAGHVFVHNGLTPELDEPVSVQLELLRRKKWHGYVTPKPGTTMSSAYNPDYPVWLGADKRISADPLPVPGKTIVSGHIRIAEPDANPIRIRIDTTGGLTEPLTACLLRSPEAMPEFVFSVE